MATSDKVCGWLEVGQSQNNEVVIYFPEQESLTDSHVLFSPDQARALAKKLVNHPDEIDRGRGRSTN